MLQFELVLKSLVLNALLACIWLLAEGFCINEDAAFLFSSTGQKLKSFLYVSGVFLGLNALSGWMDTFLKTHCQPMTGGGRISQCFQRHPFLFPFCGLLAVWSPRFLLMYPGNIPSDTMDQLRQFFGFRAWSAHHPPAFGLLCGSIVRLGSFVSGNAGVWLFLFLQAIAYAAVISYAFLFMKTIDAPGWFLSLCAFLFATSPCYAHSILIMLKDNVYSLFFLLMVIELLFMERMKEAYFQSKRHIALYSFAVTGVCLFRHDGKYILFATMFLLLVLWLRRCVSAANPRKACQRVLFCLVSPVIAAVILNASITGVLHTEKGNIREMFSLPLQQTARYVKYYGDEVTEEEKAAIAAVMDYDQLAEAYDPLISDPVKALFQSDSTSDLLNYFKTWSRMFWKHPFVYISATIHQNYYIFFPVFPNRFTSLYHYDALPLFADVIDFLNLHVVPALERPYYIVYLLDTLHTYTPILGWLDNPAAYTLVLLWLLCLAFHKRMYSFLILCSPLFFNLCIVLLSPVIQRNPRYAFPMVYALPVILSYYLFLMRRPDGTETA